MRRIRLPHTVGALQVEISGRARLPAPRPGLDRHLASDTPPQDGEFMQGANHVFDGRVRDADDEREPVPRQAAGE